MRVSRVGRRVGRRSTGARGIGGWGEGLVEPTIVSVWISISPDCSLFRCQEQCLLACSIYGRLIIGGFVIAVTAVGFVVCVTTLT